MPTLPGKQLCTSAPNTLFCAWSVINRTGRQIVMERLQLAIRSATTADLQRAAQFLEFAQEVRSGCTKQRTGARKAQANAWRKRVDDDIRW